MQVIGTRGRQGATAVVIAASVAALFLSLQPVVVGALIDLQGLSGQQAANVASANMLGQLLGSLASLALLGRVPIKRLLSVGILLLMAGDLLSALTAQQALGIAAARVLAGSGAGLTLGVASATVSALTNPARVFSVVLFCQTLSGALALGVAPSVFASIGLPGLFVALAMLALGTLLTVPYFASLKAREGTANARTRLSPMVLLLLASLGVHYLANNGVWAHFDRVGAYAGISPQRVGFALSIGQLCSLVGAASAALCSARLAPRMAMGTGLGLIMLATALLLGVRDEWTLLAAVALFIASIGFVVPFYLGHLATLDASGRMVVLGKLAIMSGLFAGPALAAAVAAAFSLHAMLLTSIGLFGVSLLLSQMAFVSRPALLKGT